MGVAADIVATYSNPVINKIAAAFTAATIKQIDQIRLVKGGDVYYVDIHYSVNTLNSVYARLDGPDGMWTTYADWPKVSDADTAAFTLAL
jgi:hypothetical protein